MKRIWSLFAVLALLCALTIPALAAAGGGGENGGDPGNAE